MYQILLVAESPATVEGNPYVTPLLFLAIAVVFYLFMIRPQQKKAKAQQKFNELVKKGDIIVTMGGIHGRIVETDATSFILEVEKGGRIKFNRSAISMELTNKLNPQKKP